MCAGKDVESLARRLLWLLGSACLSALGSAEDDEGPSDGFPVNVGRKLKGMNLKGYARIAEAMAKDSGGHDAPRVLALAWHPLLRTALLPLVASSMVRDLELYQAMVSKAAAGASGGMDEAAFRAVAQRVPSHCHYLRGYASQPAFCAALAGHLADAGFIAAALRNLSGGSSAASASGGGRPAQASGQAVSRRDEGEATAGPSVNLISMAFELLYVHSESRLHAQFERMPSAVMAALRGALAAQPEELAAAGARAGATSTAPDPSVSIIIIKVLLKWAMGSPHFRASDPLAQLRWEATWP